jgi:rSAM/selenodomain-associated transferase 2
MAVSIIIPTLNEAAIVARAVTAALATRPLEVLVADGGSGDATIALAETAGAKVVAAPRGRASQQNAAASVARGDVLLFLHADTHLADGGVSQIERALADPQVGCGAFKQSIEASGWAYRLLEDGNAWRATCRGLPYGDQGIFVRREMFDAVGGFPELGLMEDVILMRRLRRRAWPVLLSGPLYVSARHWQRRGVVRQTLLNWSLLAAARLGVHPDRLAGFYS